MNNSNNYDKVKHLVEVDDHIYAVFIVQTSKNKGLFIQKIQIQINPYLVYF
jgi:hypothetical protein